MKKKKKLVVVLATLLLTGVVVGGILVINRGASSSDVLSFKQIPALEPAVEASTKKVNTSHKLPDMRAVAQTEDLVLFFNDETAAIAVVDVKTGEATYSNPQDVEADVIASPYEKNLLRSQLILQYLDRQGNAFTFNSYEKSVQDALFLVEELENGLRVTYTIGDASKGVDALPKYMSKARFDTLIIANLEEGLARYVSARYMEMKDRPGIMERMDAQVEKQLVLNKMVNAFLEAGYTEEDLAFDNAENGVGEGSGAEKPVFTIPLEYRLEADELVVSVPFGQVTEGTEYILRSLDVLPFFGAAGLADTGYIFVPDGTGSLIYLNNGKVKEEQYVQSVYGEDVNNNSRSRKMVSESARMPVFGLKTEDKAWFAHITGAEGNSTITASISGMRNSFNNVFTTFNLRGQDWLELYTGSVYQEIKILNEERFVGTGEVRYSLLASQEASYAGMAKRYQQLLIREGVLHKRESDAIPFYLDVLGTYDHHAAFLGVPYKGISALTTYQQAEDIVSQLTEEQVANIQLRYLGWFNEGLRHTPPSSIDLDRKVGSKKELQQLAQTVAETGGQLYPDVAFSLVYEDDLAFTPSRDAARFVTREVVNQSPYNLNTNRMVTYLGEYYILSTAKLHYFATAFGKDYSKLKMTGLSLRDLGDVLASDYRVSRVIHRDVSKQLIAQTLAQFDTDYDLLMVGGHAYAWPYASHLVDVPVSSSQFNIADEVVPFYQMVLHSYIPYAGESVNLADDQDVQWATLRAIELAAYPHFTLTAGDSSDLKFTDHTAYYSTQAANWLDEAAQMYTTVKDALTPVAEANMVNRIVHAYNVVEVNYDNGVSIIVNYTDEAVTVKGQHIEARQFHVGGGR